MKKTSLAIYLIVILFICIGCEDPPDYDSKSKGWELWASGIVDKISIQISGTKRTFIVEFEGDLKFKSSHFYNFEEIKEKTKGAIYRWANLNTYYMWVPSKEFIAFPKNERKQPIIPKIITSTIEPISIEPIKSITPIINNTKILTLSKWQDIALKLPPFNQTAIVKFENGLITIAYYERPGMWKAEINRKKISGGIALKNIVQWKVIDLK